MKDFNPWVLIFGYLCIVIGLILLGVSRVIL